MSSHPPEVFNNGVALYATAENIAKAQEWTDHLTPNSGAENFDDLMYATVTSNPNPPDRVLVFTDGIVDVDDRDNENVPTRFLTALKGGSTLVDLAPIGNFRFAYLKERNFASPVENLKFTQRVVLDRGGEVYREIHAMPDTNAVGQYRAVLTRVREAAHHLDQNRQAAAALSGQAVPKKN